MAVATGRLLLVPSPVTPTALTRFPPPPLRRAGGVSPAAASATWAQRCLLPLVAPWRLLIWSPSAAGSRQRWIASACRPLAHLGDYLLLDSVEAEGGREDSR